MRTSKRAPTRVPMRAPTSGGVAAGHCPSASVVSVSVSILARACTCRGRPRRETETETVRESITDGDRTGAGDRRRLCTCIVHGSRARLHMVGPIPHCARVRAQACAQLTHLTVSNCRAPVCGLVWAGPAR